MKPHSCSRYRYTMYMYVCELYAWRRFQEQFVPWRSKTMTNDVTNCARRVENLRPQLNLTHLPLVHHPALFLPPNTHTERERQQISMRRRVSSRIIALWIGIAPWRTKVKLISIFFLFFFFFGSLFCFAFGPPPSGIVRRRPWTWTTSQWLAIKLYKNSLLQCNNNNKIIVINMRKCDTRQLYDTFSDICWVCERRKISKGRENFWTLFS